MVECVIGIGKNLFYNSPMEACIVICRAKKRDDRKGKVLFINARDEVTRKNAQSNLEDKHIERISHVYNDFSEEEGFSAVATNDSIKKNGCRLSISMYVRGGKIESHNEENLNENISQWIDSKLAILDEYTKLSEMLEVQHEV